MIEVVDWTLWIETKSEMNLREHWGTKSKRRQIQQYAIINAFNDSMPDIRLPCTIRLTRYGRKMDSDNLQSAFKAIRDAISAIIFESKSGRQDDNDLITWEYDQEKRLKPKKDAVRIQIFCDSYGSDKMPC